MDTQVIYILLLLVVTIVCIGVSAGVKYDKESYVDTSSGLKFGHVQAELTNTMTTDDQATATIVSHIKTPVDTGASTKTNLDFINSDTKENEHYATFSLLTKKITYNSGRSTKISDVDTLFGKQTTSFKAISGQTRTVTLSKLENFNFYFITFSSSKLTYTNITGSSGATAFTFDASGFVKDSNGQNFIVSSTTDLNTSTLKAKNVANEADNIMRIGKSGSDTILQFGNPVYTINTTNLFKLKYFGKTTVQSLPPPTSVSNHSISAFVSSSSTVIFNTFSQSLDSSSSNVLGFFSKYKAGVGASTTIGDFTGGIPSDTNSQIEYLKLSPNLQLQSLKASYTFTPSSLTSPFYSIYLVLDDGIQPYNPTYTITDDNTVKGTQSIVIFGSKNTDYTAGEYLLAREGSADLTTRLELTSTYLVKNLFGLYGGFNMNAIVFFPMCIQNGASSNESFTVNYDASKGFTLEQSKIESKQTTSIDYNSGYQNLNYLFYVYHTDNKLTEYLQTSDGDGGVTANSLRSA